MNMTDRIKTIKTKFYHIMPPSEIKRRGFTNGTRLAWYCLNELESDMDLTWDEAQEAASLMIDETIEYELLSS